MEVKVLQRVDQNDADPIPMGTDDQEGATGKAELLRNKFDGVCDKKLGSDDYADVYEAVKSLAPLWKSFAKALHLKQEQISAIGITEPDQGGGQSQVDNADFFLGKVLEYFLKGGYLSKPDQYPSWKLVCTGVEETDPSRFADLAQRIASEHHKPATNKETHNAASHIHIYMTNTVTSNKDPSGGENSTEANSAGKKSDGASGSGEANFSSGGPSSGSKKTGSSPKETNSVSRGTNSGESGGADGSSEGFTSGGQVGDNAVMDDQKIRSPPLPPQPPSVEPTFPDDDTSDTTAGITYKEPPTAASNTTIFENYLQRRKSTGVRKGYVNEYVHLDMEGSSTCYLEFRTEKHGSAKYTYNMKTCVGVYHRINFDYGDIVWPSDADPECCFIVTDCDRSQTLYLVAAEPTIALQWIKELRRHLNVHKRDKRKGEFGIDDFANLSDVLVAEKGHLYWKKLGKYLGLRDSTLNDIGSRHSKPEECLLYCLSRWLRRYDDVDDKGGPTHSSLKNALKLINKEEIAEKISETFNGARTSKGTEKQRKKNQCADENQEKVWVNAKRRLEYDQAIENIKDKENLKSLFDKVSDKMEADGVAAVLPEIIFLSNKKKSCLVTIENKVAAPIMYRKCFIVSGCQSSYYGFDDSILPDDKRSYCFEKSTLEECSAMIFFAVDISLLTHNQPAKIEEADDPTDAEPNECFFMVSFKKFLFRTSSNKVALMFLNDAKSENELFSAQKFEKIINNEKESPDISGCYDGIDCLKKFAFRHPGSIASLDFKVINFTIKIDDDSHHTQVTVVVQQQ